MKKERFRVKKKSVSSRGSNFKKNGYGFAVRQTSRLRRKPKPIIDDDFERDSRGRIKGSYINGMFIPD